MYARLRHPARVKCGGRPRTSAGSSATPTSSTRRCSSARRQCLYEGKPVGTPDAGAFWRVLAEHEGESAVHRADRVAGDQDGSTRTASEIAKYDLSALRTLFLAGERLDPETLHWARDKLGVPVIDHWWQTETGWPIAANPRGLEPMSVKPGSATVPVPGWDVRILDPEGAELPPGQQGAIAIRLPLPPGSLPTLWNDDQRYVEEYLSRVRRVLPHR